MSVDLHPEDPEAIRNKLLECIATLRQASYDIDMYPSSAAANCKDIDEVIEKLETLL